MDYLFQDGGKPKKTKSKTASKTKSSTKTTTKTPKSKSSSKTGTKTTKSKTTSKKSSSKKGGNFLGAVGDLVAPTGWGPFATAAGLLALDRADAALRRGKSEKSSAKKGGMRGGDALSIYKDFLKKIDYSRNKPQIFANLTDEELFLRRSLRSELSSEKNLSKNEIESTITDMIKKAQEEVNFIPISFYIIKFKNSYKKQKNGNNSNKNYEKDFRDILSTKFKLEQPEIDDYVFKFKSAVDNNHN